MNPAALDAIFAAPIGALLIFCCRIVDVSCDTMRVLFAIRGRRLVAGALGFVQAIVWIFAVGAAVKHLDSPLHILGYSLGYATGTVVGISIEQWIAYGLATVRIISTHGGVEIAHALREKGYGVTESSGFGREGTVEILSAVVQRAHLDDVLKIIEAWDETAFVTVEEPRVLLGGSFPSREWKVPVFGKREGG